MNNKVIVLNTCTCILSIHYMTSVSNVHQEQSSQYMYIYAHYMIYDTSIKHAPRIEFLILMSAIYLILYLLSSTLYKEKEQISILPIFQKTTSSEQKSLSQGSAQLHGVGQLGCLPRVTITRVKFTGPTLCMIQCFILVPRIMVRI